MPPSSSRRRLLQHPVGEPTVEPTEFAPAVYRTRNPTKTLNPTYTKSPQFHYTTNPTPSHTHHPTEEKSEERELKKAGPADHTAEPTMDPTEMVHKTRSPNHYRTREPSGEPSPSPPTDMPLLWDSSLQSDSNTAPGPLDHITEEPTMDPTEMVHKTRSPNHYRTREPSGEPSPSPPTDMPLLWDSSLKTDSAETVVTHKRRAMRLNQGPGNHEPTVEPTEFAPAVYRTRNPTKTLNPTYTKSPQFHYTTNPTPSHTHHPTEEKSEERELKKAGPADHTAEPTEEPTALAPAVYETLNPTEIRTYNPTWSKAPSYTKSPQIYFTTNPTPSHTHHPTEEAS
jgi:hypothetical protein